MFGSISTSIMSMLQSSQIILVVYRGCYAIISLEGLRFYYTRKVFFWIKSKDLLMDSHLMTHHPQCTIKMICEEFNIDIQRVLMNIKQVNILTKIHSKKFLYTTQSWCRISFLEWKLLQSVQTRFWSW